MCLECVSTKTSDGNRDRVCVCECVCCDYEYKSLMADLRSSGLDLLARSRAVSSTLTLSLTFNGAHKYCLILAVFKSRLSSRSRRLPAKLKSQRGR